METESVAKRAIALLSTAGAMRTAQIAEALKVTTSVIASSLGPYAKNGTLIACKVESPGTPPTNEWRIGAGAKTAARDNPWRRGTTTPPVPVPAEGDAQATAKPKRAYKRAAPVRKTHKPVRKAHKPVRKTHKTVRAIHKTVPSAKRRAVPPKVSELRKWWNDLHSTPHEAAAGRNLRTEDADLRTAHADTPAIVFRTAIASDGAMLFIGAAAGTFELTREEARAVVGFVRELDAGTATEG